MDVRISTCSMESLSNTAGRKNFVHIIIRNPSDETIDTSYFFFARNNDRTQSSYPLKANNMHLIQAKKENYVIVQVKTCYVLDNNYYGNKYQGKI